MKRGFAPAWLNRLKKIGRSRTRARLVGVVVSYPKSGRTWLRLMFHELGVPFAFTHDGSGGSKGRSFEELKLFSKEIYAGVPVVFLFRDPRDTAVSSYFWETHRVDPVCPGSISEFIRSPSHGVEKIVRFNLAWLKRGPDLPDFLPITYEELTATPLVVLRRILGFVGSQFSVPQIERVVADNQFERLHQRERQRENLEGTIATRTKNPMHWDPNDPELVQVQTGKERWVCRLSVPP